MSNEHDEIFINKIKAYGYHGVFEKENREGQWFLVDLKIFLALDDAAQSDDLSRSVDYSRAVIIAKKWIEHRPPFKLIERLAGVIADEILATFPQIRKIEVTVHKPHAPVDAEFDDIGVKIVKKGKKGV